MKWLWPILRHNTVILIEGPRKVTINLNQDTDLAAEVRIGYLLHPKQEY
jgi:hypothetical protein